MPTSDAIREIYAEVMKTCWDESLTRNVMLPPVATHNLARELWAAIKAHVEAEPCVWVRYPSGDAMDGSARAYRPTAHADLVPKLWQLDCEMRGWYNCPYCGRKIEVRKEQP